MKPKVKLDADTIKQSLIEHVEKVLFGLVVLFFLFFVYRAIARERPIGFTPEELKAEADAAEAKVLSSVTNAPGHRKFSNEAKKLRDPIDEKDYLTKNYWDPSPFPNPKPRLQPKLYALLEPRATAGMGAFSVMDTGRGPETGGMGMKGERWVVITGAIDWDNQVKSYEDAFKDTLPIAQRFDWPMYTYYRVERAEVNPQDPNPPKDEDFKPVNVRKMAELVYEMGGMYGGGGPGGGSESQFVDPYYTQVPVAPNVRVPFVFPLPSLVTGTWGPEVGHPRIPAPDLSLRDSGPLGPRGRLGPRGAGTLDGGPGSAAPGKTQPDDGTGKAGEPAGSPKRPARPAAIEEPDEPEPLLGVGPTGAGGDMGRPSGGMGPRPGMVPFSGPTGPAGRGMGPGFTGPGGRPMTGSSDAGSGFAARPYGGGDYGGDMTAVQSPKYLLFRFFDYTVQPGRYYQYRVQLWLANPNYGLPPQYLENEGLAQQDHLRTPFSAPTATVPVPLDSRVLLAPAKPKDAAAGMVGILAVHLNMVDGMEAFHEVTAGRGQLLNYLKQKFEQGTGPGGDMGGPMVLGRGRPPFRPGADLLGAPILVDYTTEAVLLDFSGGNVLPGRDRDLLEPQSVLMADQAGNLIVREEMDDQPDYYRFVPSKQSVYGPGPLGQSSDMGGSSDGGGPKKKPKGGKGATPLGPYSAPSGSTGPNPGKGKGGPAAGLNPSGVPMGTPKGASKGGGAYGPGGPALDDGNRPRRSRGG